MSSILISHRNKSHDNDWAGRIHAWIKDQKDIDGFLDFNIQHGLQAGGNWENDIYAAMNRAQVVIALLSPDWLESDWCMSEARMAKLRGLQLIPAMIADCKNPFPEIQYIDFTTDHDGAFERLRSALKTTHPLPKQPYPGLCAFQEKDAAVFFGREDETRDLINRVASLFQGRPETPRLLLVLGASGSGKSSLVRAGLVPEFRSDPQQICLEPIIPRGAPLKEIARELDITFDGLDPAACADNILAALKQRNSSFERALITIDQAEELLRGDNKFFFSVMRLLLGKGDGRIVLLATMRSDFLNEFQQSGVIGGGSGIEYDTFAINPMPDDRLSDIIRKPANLYGVEYQDALIGQIASDHGGSDAMPLLAFFLSEFWRPDYIQDGELQLSEYEAYGGLSKALEKAVDRAFGECQRLDHAYADEKALLGDLKEVFLGLLVSISSVSGEPIRNRVSASALSDNQRSLLVPFEKQRLLISKNDEWEVVHEALFRQWTDLKEWIEEAREDLVAIDRLKTAAKRWQDERREDHDLVHSGNRLSEAIRLSLSARYASRFLPVDKDYLDACAKRDRDELEKERKARERERTLREQAEKERENAERESGRAQKGESKAKRYTNIAAVVALFALISGVLAGWQWWSAERRAAETTAALIWSQLYFDAGAPGSEPAVTALWDLATSNANVRDAFLTQLSEQNHLVTLFRQGAASIVRAFGLVHGSSDSVKLLTPVLKAMGETTDSDQLEALSSAVVALGPKLDAEQAAVALTRVLEVMGETTDSDQLEALSSAVVTLGPKLDAEQAAAVLTRVLKVMGETTDSDQLEALSSAVAALGPTPGQAAVALTRVLKAMGETTDHYQLAALSSAVVTLGPKLDAEQAAAVLTRVLKVMGETTDSHRLAALSSAVVTLGPTPGQAAVALTRVLKAMGETTDSHRLAALSSAVVTLGPTPGQAAAALTSVLKAKGEPSWSTDRNRLLPAVETLAPKLEAEQAAVALTPVLKAMGETTASHRLAALSSVVAILGPKLDAEQASAALAPALKAMGETTASYQLAALSSAVAILGPKLDGDQAATALTSVLKAMAKATTSGDLDRLSSAVVALGPKLDAEQAAAALTFVIKAMGETTFPSTLAALSSAVATLEPKLDAEQAAAAALTRVLKVMGETTASKLLVELSPAVETLAPKLEAEQAAAVLAPVLKVMGETTDSDQLEALSSAVVTLGPKLDAEQAAAALTRVLKVMGETTDHYQLAALSSAVAALGPTPGQVAAALTRVLKVMGETTDSSTLAALSSAVAVSSPTPAQASAALTFVIKAMGETTNSSTLAALSSAVATLAPKLDAEQAAAALTPVLKVIGETTDSRQLRALSSAVAILGPKLDAEQAAAALTPVLNAVGKATDSYQFEALSSAVATLAPKLDAEQAAAALTPVLKVIGETTDSRQLRALSSAVAILGPKLDAEQAAAALTPVFKAMGETTDSSTLAALSSAVAVSSPTPAQASAALTFVIKAMGETTNSSTLAALSSAVATLERRLDSTRLDRIIDLMRWRLSTSYEPPISESLSRTIALSLLRSAVEPRVYVTEVVNLLKMPTTVGSATIAILSVMAERIPSAPGGAAGLQANIDWIKDTYPSIDLKRQPVRPSFTSSLVNGLWVDREGADEFDIHQS